MRFRAASVPGAKPSPLPLPRVSIRIMPPRLVKSFSALIATVSSAASAVIGQ